MMGYSKIKSVSTVSVLNRKMVLLWGAVPMCSHQSWYVQYVEYSFRTQFMAKRDRLSTVSVLNRLCLNDAHAFIHAGFGWIYGLF